MAVSLDELLTPLVPAEVRDDLIYLGGLLRLPIPRSPGEPMYQLTSWLGRWGSGLWNKYAIQALRAQFGDTASGDWATLLWAGRGTDRVFKTFAAGPVPFENRSGSFYNLTSPGAVSISNANAKTFTSTGPAPGYAGTLAPWAGGSDPYPVTWLTMQADVEGSASNTPAATVAGYPITPASAPPGVYVVAADQPSLLGSDGESDAQLLTRGRASVADAAAYAPLQRYTAIALGTKLPGPPPIPVSTSRVRAWGASATVNVYLATPTGPAPGNLATPGTDVYEINARIQRLCGAPGLSILVRAATLLPLAVGTITIYVTQASNVSAQAAHDTAAAALDEWQSQIPIGGMRKVPGGQGWIFSDELKAIAMSRVVPSVPWERAVTVFPGEQYVANGGAYFTVDGGVTSATGAGPSGQTPSKDGTVQWVYVGPARSGFESAPGVFDCDLSFADTMVDVGEVATLSYTINVAIVEQEG